MGNKLSEPIKVGNLTFKNRIMFPPLTTGYEERDGSIGARSLNFYERLAKRWSSVCCYRRCSSCKNSFTDTKAL